MNTLPVQNNLARKILSLIGRFKTAVWIVVGFSLAGALYGAIHFSARINDEEKTHGEVVYSTARVRILESKIRALLGQIELRRRDGKSANELLEDVSRTTDRATTLFNSYLTGGQIKAVTGRIVYLRPVKSPEGIAAAQALEKLWVPVERKIRLAVQMGTVDSHAVTDALQLAQEDCATITKLSETLAVEEDKYHFSQIEWLTWTRNLLGIYLSVVAGLLIPVVVLVGQVQKSHSQLAVTMASITEGVISTDLHNRIVLMNRVAEDLTGWVRVEAKGQRLDTVLQIKPSDIQSEQYIALPEGYTIRSLQSLTLVSRRQEQYAIDGSYGPILNEEGAMIGHIAVFQDQTEKLKLQSQLALSSKLQSIGQLAAGVAHEINTPMQFIGDNTGFLDKSFQDLSQVLESYEQLESQCRQAGQFSEALGRIKKTKESLDADYLVREIPSAIDQTLSGIERVTKLVKAMKTFSYPNQGKMQLHNLNHCIEATVNVCRNEWKYVADMELDFDPSLPAVPCLIDELNQVILNMVTNSAHSIQDAIRAGHYPKGTIRVGTKRVDNEAHILIQDSGMGIPSEVIDKIYDPFFTTKELGKGTGQGLAISHDILVNKHKGRIEVESKVGQGTRFTLVIPTTLPLESALGQKLGSVAASLPHGAEYEV